MNDSECSTRLLHLRTKASWKRRMIVLFRLAVRRLSRLELVERDSHGNPKANPIRWIV